MSYFSIHNHSHFSNLRLKDALSRPKELIEYSNEVGIKGISLTDHETISGSMEFLEAFRTLKENGEIDSEFKATIGNEIYLIREDSIEELKENYKDKNPLTQFYHFLLTAINEKGAEQIRELSSIAWQNSFNTGLMTRVPTLKEDMKRVITGGNVVATSACFPHDSLVKTKKGLREISKIEKGEEVLTHKGEWKIVVKPTTRHYDGYETVIKNIGSSFDITSTENHKFLTIPHYCPNSVKINKETINKNYYNELVNSHQTVSKYGKAMMKRNSIVVEPKWVEAKNLDSTHCLLTPIEEDIIDIDSLDLTKYHIDKPKYELPNNLRITPRFMKVLGFYAAEGSLNTFSKNSITISTHSKKTDLITMVTSFFEEELKMAPRIYNKKDSEGVDITIGSTEVYNMFSDLFKSGSTKKALPEFARYLPPYLQSYFVKGLFLGDGYTRVPKRNNVSFSTTSKQLVADVVHILHRLGINPAVNTNPASFRDGVNRKEWYSTEINGKLGVALHNFIWEDKELSITIDMKRSRDIPYLHNNIKYMKHRVSSVNKIKISKRVYCLEVEDDHSFVVEGAIAHNCLGGLVPQMILKWLEAEKEEDNDILKKVSNIDSNEIGSINFYKKEIHEFIKFCVEVFGKDKFFLEIQPSENEEQHAVNRKLIELSEIYHLDYIVATDTHYTKKEDRQAHRIYLQSSDGEREVDEFYDSTRIFSEQELYDSMSSHLTQEEIKASLDNTLKIYDMVEEIDLRQKTIIPHADVEPFELNHLFKPAYNQFNYIEKFAYSDYEIDRYMLYLIEEGFKEHFPTNTLTKDYFYKVMGRIDIELKELWLISERLGDRMSSYYVLTREIVLDVIWDKANSICGIARGSAAGYLLNHLLNITQINPLDYDLPHFRHLTAERPELPDCYDTVVYVSNNIDYELVNL